MKLTEIVNSLKTAGYVQKRQTGRQSIYNRLPEVFGGVTDTNMMLREEDRWRGGSCHVGTQQHSAPPPQPFHLPD